MHALPEAVSPITEQEFAQFRRFIFDEAGITLGASKKVLVSVRLAQRLQNRGVRSYGEYFAILASGRDRAEIQTAVDLLTTNETYFFREMKHFEFLRATLMSTQSPGRAPRIWSAAASSGEEAYSIAMLLEDCLPGVSWEVLATDVSLRMIELGRAARYPMQRARDVPPDYLRRFCLKGRGTQDGTLLVDRGLRARVSFRQVNLNQPLPQIGSFDFIFLRNVLIYFNTATRQAVTARVASVLKSGGWLLIGHAENLNQIVTDLEQAAPSIYRKP